MPEPYLSVIMGVYNCPSEKMLLRAVDSIVNQTYKNLEFIICDDGSTNDTVKWLHKKAVTDSRIKIIENKKNQGLAHALNKCLEVATGDFIARQDVDDYSTLTRFQIQIDFLKNNKDIAFVGSGCLLYDQNCVYGERHVPEYPKKTDFLFNSPFVHGTVIFRREVFEKCGNYKAVGKCLKYEDYEFFMRVYSEGFKGANINQLLYTFYSEEKKNMVSRQMRFDEFKVRREGFKKLGLMPRGIPYVLKPLVLIAVPNKLLFNLKNLKKSGILCKRTVLLSLYGKIVNRNSYIKYNYEGYVNSHRELHTRFPLISWLYLLRLNIESLVFKRTTAISKKVKSELNSSGSGQKYSTQEIADMMRQYDVISFDMFDTLVFRPFSEPTALFYIVGEKLKYPDFKTIRTVAEQSVRKICKSEINIKHIYDYLEKKAGIDSDDAINAEKSAEYELCIANPFMKEIWDKLRDKKKIIVSDMYLPAEFLGKILEKNGFTGYEKIYVSCDYDSGKCDGKLYETVKKDFLDQKIIHIGDNYHSDIRNAGKHGFSTIQYKNVNELGESYRPKDMSPIICSAYSGIVNKKMYSGYEINNSAYNFGYKYGGILQLGFCNFIRDHALKHKADKILFLSRDGYMTKKIFDSLYSDMKTEYVYWSRNCSAKLGADLFKDNFFKRFLHQKINNNIKIKKIFESIGFEGEYPFEPESFLTSDNADTFEQFIEEKFEDILCSYEDMNKAAKMYFETVLEGCGKVITVDCGWAGSGNIILEQVANKKWNINCEFVGLLAGSNSYSQFDMDISETFFITEKMTPYCFSSSFNRDKFMVHSPAAKHNVYFEMLFTAPEPSFLEFTLTENGYGFVFDKQCENKQLITDIQKGETDFVKDYVKAFEKYPFMRNISGSDAYTPFMYAVKHNNKEIEKVFENCIFDELTNGEKTKIK
ncbi:MAG: glycosyltransferase [Oscillospiraceae bacterium]|nr:glycosyltransferase [Oscillospiraceae bacterium]